MGLNLETFGNIIDDFLKENEIKMLITLPEGTLDPVVEDNARIGSVIAFYIMLNAIKPIAWQMAEEMEIDTTGEEWEKVVSTLLEMIKKEILEEEGKQ